MDVSQSPYLPGVPETQRATYTALSGDLELAEEIRLVRYIVVLLARELPTTHKEIGQALTVLLRAISLQSHVHTEVSELERAITEVAGEVRRDLAGEERGGPSDDAPDEPAGDSRPAWWLDDPESAAGTEPVAGEGEWS